MKGKWVKKMIEVGAAIIENAVGEILIARRRSGKSQAGLWEFPGGKLEENESVESCIERELREEMNIEVRAGAWYGANEFDYGAVQIRLIAHKALYISGAIQLVDHDEFRWVRRAELGAFDFAPADVPFVERLQKESA
jgi:8-oxo-dGTP diphosphatase